jgi:hypothetical protein
LARTITTGGSFARRFADRMPYTITVEPWEGNTNDYGEPTYGAAVTLQCRIQDRAKLVRDAQGNERSSTTTIYVAGGPLRVEDRITLPESHFGNANRPIMNIANLDDRMTFDHSEIYL